MEKLKLDIQLFATEITDYSMTEANTVLKSIEPSTGYFDDKFVRYLSQKEIDITYTSTDTIRYFNLLSNRGIFSSGEVASSSSLPIVYDTSNETLLGNYYYVSIKTTSETVRYSKIHGMNPSTNYADREEQLDFYTILSYVKPTLSNITIKRPTPTSNSVDITCNGSYFKGTLGTENHGNTYKPTIIGKYWEAGQTESQATTFTIPSSSITVDNTGTGVTGTYSVSYNKTGIDYQKAYRFKLEIQDRLIGETTYFSNAISSEYSVTAGIPLWSEFADRVDFLKLTINHQEMLAPYTIYESTGSNATITLTDTSDSFDNYEYVEIFYRTNDDDYKSVKVFEPNGKYVLLDASAISGSYTYVKTAHYSLSGNSMTLRSGLYGQARIGNNVATTWNTNSNRIYVTRIIGYK